MVHDEGWHTSPFSGATGQCVELRYTPDGGVEVRDTKDRAAGSLSYTRGEWAAFVRGIREDEAFGKENLAL